MRALYNKIMSWYELEEQVQLVDGFMKIMINDWCMEYLRCIWQVLNYVKVKYKYL